MEGRPPPAAPKPYAKAGVILDGTEPVPPVLECAFGDWFAIARGAHDPPGACRLRPRDCFSTGSYSVARCDLLRLNPGVTETAGCFAGASLCAQPGAAEN